MRKENASYKCLLILTLDSFVKVRKNHCPQTLLEECKGKIKKTEIESFINEVHLMIKLIVTLIMNLTMNLTINLKINLAMNSFQINLKIKTVF